MIVGPKHVAFIDEFNKRLLCLKAIHMLAIKYPSVVFLLWNLP